jgi:Family of unknown function (DUF6636)
MHGIAPMKPRIGAILAPLACLGVLAGCGNDGDSTTVINNTTTVTETAGSSTTNTAITESSSTTTGGGGGDSSGSQDVVSLDAFQSPSGNIACLMSAKGVRCDIAEKQWNAPRPPGCPKQVDYGQGLALDATGPAAVVCAGDTVLNPQAPVLDYGTASQVGSIRCDSQESGIKCENGAGGEFSLSREAYELS